jgi:hypothetical protein
MSQSWNSALLNTHGILFSFDAIEFFHRRLHIRDSTGVEPSELLTLSSSNKQKPVSVRNFNEIIVTYEIRRNNERLPRKQFKLISDKKES